MNYSGYDEEDPLDKLWSKRSDETREGLAAGPDIVGMEFEPTSLEALYRHRLVFNRLKQDTRLLALLDILYPRKEGVFVDTQEIVMGDYTVSALLEDSPNHPIVEELNELHGFLEEKAGSNIGISNQDMFKRYISTYEQCLGHAREFRRQVAGAKPPSFYMQCNFENSRILEISQAYETVLERAIDFYDEQSGTGGETWPISERIRLPSFRSGFDALMEISERQ